ncbi:MAG: hypothetical protein R3E45_02900 [Rhodocyclaceae bacterium]|nr:hypothetical protein [Rhodocyclaceae bacterium]MCP5231225.1 hypothetical protein [Zoogloeaceae bacterium]MCP5241422.1 hypothetical protein [Zoogloeaceae bacterium]MCP5252996.1 hypothetical protein [Zoogloeaceae bacterium]MCP5293261.1 hypothetical protein [Zoogloeaceae bacterium]
MASSRVYLPFDSWEPTEFPTILAIGDSWFWYPRNNVLQALVDHPRLKDPYRFIQLLGYNGAKLEQYVFGRYARDLEKHLSAGFRTAYSAIMISGAGNDAVDYKLALARDCSTIADPSACLDQTKLDAFIGKLMAAMGALVQRITLAYGGESARPDIFIHCYDYPMPDGRGFKLADLKITGPWLKPAMVSRKVDKTLAFRAQVCRALIDHIAKAYQDFAASQSRVYCIDSRGCLRNEKYRKDWDNELHPSMAGFKQVVDECWIPVLAEHGYAK